MFDQQTTVLLQHVLQPAGRSLFLCLLIVMSLAPQQHALAQSDSDYTLPGIYWNEEKNAKVEIYEEQGKIFGKVIWQENPRKDVNNPDPALQQRELPGLIILRDFTSNGKGTWTGGRVYSPDNGKTYKGKMWLTKEGHLKMRGYIGISMLGRSAILERVEVSP